MIAITYGLAAELPLVLRRLPAPQLPPMAGPAGLMVQAAGLALRAWSMRTLGASYSRTLRAGQEQHVVDTGPYRLVRHPGYAGSLLTWTGFALASRSTLVLALVAALLGGACHHRIIAEEQLLQRDLPGYIAYSQHTKKTHPFRLVTAPSRGRIGLQGEEGSFPRGRAFVECRCTAVDVPTAIVSGRGPPASGKGQVGFSSPESVCAGRTLSEPKITAGAVGRWSG